MEVMDLVQARTPKNVKETANEILAELGLNMSTYINMSLKQLIIQGGIPFTVKMNSRVYSAEETVNEVYASLNMEGMPLTLDDIEMLKAIKTGNMTADEARQKILSEV